jgi:hypothetical protein
MHGVCIDLSGRGEVTTTVSLFSIHLSELYMSTKWLV